MLALTHKPFPAVLIGLFALVASAPGCTFGVSAIEIEAEGTLADTSGVTTIRSALGGLDSHIAVSGEEGRSAIDATLRARGLVQPGDEDAARESMGVALTRSGEVVDVGLTREGRFGTLLRLSGAEVLVPLGMNVELDLDESSATIVDVRDATVTADSGSIDLTYASGHVTLQAGSGSISALGVAGEAFLRTGSGSIEVELGGGIDAQAGSGSIHGFIGDGGSASAGSGSIDLTLTDELTRNLSLETGSGSVHLVLPADLHDVDLDLDAGSGSIHVCVGDVEIDTDEEGVRRTIGAGGRIIYVRTGSGSITVTQEGR